MSNNNYNNFNNTVHTIYDDLKATKSKNLSLDKDRYRVIRAVNNFNKIKNTNRYKNNNERAQTLTTQNIVNIQNMMPYARQKLNAENSRTFRLSLNL